MTAPVSDLSELLRLHAKDWSKEDLELGRRTGVRILELQARRAAGEDVTALLNAVYATALNLATGAEMTGVRVLTLWVQRVAAAVATSLLSA